MIMDGLVSPAPAIHCLHPSLVYSLVTVLYVLIIMGAVLETYTLEFIVIGVLFARGGGGAL